MGGPELAIEIISPSETAAELLRKASQYLDGGAIAVWLVRPEDKVVYGYENGSNSIRILRAGDTIQGSGPLAGFSAPVSAFF